MPLEIVVTNAGRAALINADNTGTAPVTITQVGLSSTAVVPVQTDTTLAGEFKRVGAVSGEVVADDTIHLSVMDFSGDSYTLRSVGLYLADGTLFAIYGQPGAILEKTASSDAALSLDVILADISAALLTFGDATFSNPPASETRQGVAEIATQAESNAGADDVRFVTPKKNRTSFLAWFASALPLDLWRASNDGAGSGLDADLLDGQQGSYYTAIVARLGYNPVQQGTGVGQQSNPVKIGWKPNSRLGLTVDSVDLGVFVLDGHISDVWRASNDGAGSGLDADMLDGVHAASFARTDLGTGATFSGGVIAPYLRSTGTADIDGAMGVGGHLQAAGGLRSGDANGLLLKPGGHNPTVIFRNDGARLYIMSSAAAAGYNPVWNALRPLSIDLGTGRLHSENGQTFSGGAAFNGLLRVDGMDVVALQSADGNPSFGYRVYRDGFKHMWGTNSYAGDQNKTINFPFAFSSWAHTFLEGGVNSNGQQENGPFVLSSTIHGFSGLNAANASVAVMWHAFGY